MSIEMFLVICSVCIFFSSLTGAIVGLYLHDWLAARKGKVTQ
jgi:hypothetical protein